ncbi:MAG: nuclear transport factor 2 family protein [Rhizobiaceae bacterium]|nr:nuclear transport factor 2 family protein [Rhizobiaceae bacterium]
MFDPKDPSLSKRKKLVLEFMDGVLHGDRLDMLDTHVRADYIQHTPGIGQGREGIRKYFEEVSSKRPNRTVWRPVMMVEEGDIVVLFKWLPHAWIADFMRFDENDLLAEHWDVVQAWSDGSPKPEDLGTQDLGRFKKLFNLPDDGR